MHDVFVTQGMAGKIPWDQVAPHPVIPASEPYLILSTLKITVGRGTVPEPSATHVQSQSSFSTHRLPSFLFIWHLL